MHVGKALRWMGFGVREPLILGYFVLPSPSFETL